MTPPMPRRRIVPGIPIPAWAATAEMRRLRLVRMHYARMIFLVAIKKNDLAKMQHAKQRSTYPDDNETLVGRARESLAELSYGCNHLVRECASSGAMKKSLLLVAAVAILVGVIALGGGSMQAGSSRGGTTVSHPTNDYSEIDPRRMYAIQARIFDSGLSDRNDLDVAGTPQYQSIHWLTADDEAQLSPDDLFLLQRYGLAVFFFTTYVTSEMEDRAGLPTVSDPNIAPGSEWKVVTNWMSGSGYCDWHGMECHTNDNGWRVYDANAGVTRLNLTANNILSLRVNDNGFVWTVPESWSRLTNLDHLYMHNNKLGGQIPTGLSGLTSLAKMRVNGNEFTGSVPSAICELYLVELHADCAGKVQCACCTECY